MPCLSDRSPNTLQYLPQLLRQISHNPHNTPSKTPDHLSKHTEERFHHLIGGFPKCFGPRPDELRECDEHSSENLHKAIPDILQSEAFEERHNGFNDCREERNDLQDSVPDRLAQRSDA